MNGKFEHQIIIGFVYVREKKRWILSQLIGERAAMDLGIRYVLLKSPRRKYPQETHLTNLILALARHPEKLDGGGIDRSISPDRDKVEITVKPRNEKPQHQEKVWKESP
jgi:hypothetical protein